MRFLNYKDKEMLPLNYFSFLTKLAGSASTYQKYPAYIFFNSSIDEVSSINKLLFPRKAKHIKLAFFLFPLLNFPT